MGLPAPPARVAGFDISRISGTFAVASMVSFQHGRPDRPNYRRYRIRSVAGQDDFACMAEAVRRRYTRLLSAAPARDTTAAPGLPDLIVIDGGKGQLNAARAELAKLRLGHLPILGLAKEFEEIHRPDHPAPLRLSSESGALKYILPRKRHMPPSATKTVFSDGVSLVLDR